MVLRILAAALLPAFTVGARAADTLTVFTPGDTARASAVNANFKLLLDRVNALAAANLRLSGKVDSLQKAEPPAPRPNMDSLEAKIAEMRAQMQVLHTRVDSAGNLSHVHPVSQVTGLRDSLDARVAALGGPLKVCTGKTAPGIGWANYNANGAQLEVNTSACGFSSAPQYFTSLGSTTSHWLTTGVTSIYTPTATGFKVYVGNQPWSDTATHPPASWGMYVNWVAIGP